VREAVRFSDSQIISKIPNVPLKRMTSSSDPVSQSATVTTAPAPTSSHESHDAVPLFAIGRQAVVGGGGEGAGRGLPGPE